MLKSIGYKSLEDMAKATVPESIRNYKQLDGLGFNKGMPEAAALNELRQRANKNIVLKSVIGMGFYGTKTPLVIKKNLIENHQWVSAYTPYQAEISQGRLEMLLNFQTVISDLTGLPVANCSLLDEASAAAESVTMCSHLHRGKRNNYFVDENCHPQTIGCVQTRGKALGITITVGDVSKLTEKDLSNVCGVLVQYPDTRGAIRMNNYKLAEMVHAAKAKLVVATDLLACTMLKPPGEFGADIVLGSSQRFGVPMFFGGPHAGFMSTTDDLKRVIPGRIIGVSIDSQGNRALRMALQAREQFIRREKAISNICTAQALLANVAASYAIYHGPEGLRQIAQTVNNRAIRFAKTAIEKYNFSRPKSDENTSIFDTIALTPSSKTSIDEIIKALEKAGYNARSIKNDEPSGPAIGFSFDETTTEDDIDKILSVLSKYGSGKQSANGLDNIPLRSSSFLTHPTFNSYHSETNLNRYLASLESKDLTLRQCMIPLGSCTMKLNAASELTPVLWPEVADLHPFAPEHQVKGMHEMINELNLWLAEITGFAAVSAQPNSGATGEYAGLLAIRAYQESKGEGHRNVCLIPASAHGTNPASAVLAGLQVVGVKSDDEGNVCLVDLANKAKEYKDKLSCFMITFPSTYGKFEVGVTEAIKIVHENGGQVYMDGANLNAQLGMCSPGSIGADVCHLNLHKTFAIPHGGGGPGVGAIGVAEHLAPFLPGHCVVPESGTGRNIRKKKELQVTSAQFGSAGILPIPWMYIRMMGAEGLLQSSQVAILNANYMAKRLEKHYKILFRGPGNMCAHEFIVDMREFKKFGITEDDVAKRLADYGFHAPTMSWPVIGTLMIEPTESEDKAECDRLVDALISIREEIREVESGKIKAEDSPLHHAPHTAAMVTSDKWDKKYTRQQAAFPAKKLPFGVKYWPTVSRLNALYGDRNLQCTCPPVEAYSSTKQE